MSFDWEKYEEVPQAKVQSNSFDWEKYEEVPQATSNKNQSIPQKKKLTPEPQKKESVIPDNPQPNESGAFELSTEYVPTYEELNKAYKNGQIGKDDLITQSKRRLEQDYKDADKIKRNAAIRNTIGGTLVGVGAIPLFDLPVTGAIGGALTGWGEGILNNKSAKTTLGDIGLGAGLGFLTGKLPVIGNAIGKTKIGQAIGNKATKMTEKVFDKMASSETGAKVLSKIDDIGIFLTKNRTLPNFNVPLKEQSNDAISLTFKDLKNNIKNNQFEPRKLQTVKGVNRKGKVWTHTLENEENGVINAERDFNNIINEISNNTQKVNDTPYLQDVENRIQNIIDKSPYANSEEFANSFWDKYAKTLDDAFNYNELKFGTNKNNYFGGEDIEAPDWLNKYTKGEKKQSKLPNTMREKETLPPEFDSINPEYEVLHNVDLKNQAGQELSNNPEIGSILRDKAKSEKYEYSALDFETARQTIQKLYNEGKVNEALELTELVSQKASKAGQAVQALSLWSKTTPEGAIKQAQKIISDYNQSAKKKIPSLTVEQAQNIRDLANNIQATETGTRANDVATAQLMKYFSELIPQSAGNKLKTLRNISLLLNPKTFGRNIVGNTIFAGMENAITKPIAAGIDTLVSPLTKQKTRVLPRINEYTKGMFQGLKEGTEDVILGINTRKGIGSRFDLPERASFNGVPILEQLEKGLNYSLSVPDRAFYQATFNESLANQMKAKGVTEPTQEMLQNAYNEAMESVYQNNSLFGNTVLNARKMLNNLGTKDFGLGDALVPYAQTPANVIQQGINYSPLGLLKGGYNALQGNQRQATLDIARGLAGSGIIGGGYALAKNGLTSPDEEMKDYQTKQNYMAKGIRPNAIKIGNKYYSYSQLQPLSSPLASGIGFANSNSLQGAIDNSLNALIDTSMLKGVNNFISDINGKNGQEGSFTNALTNVAANLPSQFIPTSVNQVNTYVDPIVRETYDPNPLKQGVNKAIARTLYLSKTLPEKVDVTGQPVMKTKSTGVKKAYDVFANPIFENEPKRNPVIDEALRLQQSTGEKTALLPVPKKKYKGRELSAEEYHEYSKKLGQVTSNLLEDYMNTPLYNNLSDDERIAEIRNIKKIAKSTVEENLFMSDNEKKQAQLDKIRKKLIAKYDARYKMLKKANKLYNESADIKAQNYYDSSK